MNYSLLTDENIWIFQGSLTNTNLQYQLYYNQNIRL